MQATTRHRRRRVVSTCNIHPVCLNPAAPVWCELCRTSQVASQSILERAPSSSPTAGMTLVAGSARWCMTEALSTRTAPMYTLGTHASVSRSVATFPLILTSPLIPTPPRTCLYFSFSSASRAISGTCADPLSLRYPLATGCLPLRVLRAVCVLLIRELGTLLRTSSNHGMAAVPSESWAPAGRTSPGS